MSGYTVIDLETTGLFPQKHHRVVELAMVKLSDDGLVQDEWSTLVNPQRDVGPTRIHGVKAADVLDAPTFAEIAHHVIGWLSGRTMVAHNARFDAMFLDAEFERAGAGTSPPTPSLCTMQWSGTLLGQASRKLVDCCAAVGVTHDAEHTALGDARATAALLGSLLERAGRPVPWERRNRDTRGHLWPLTAVGSAVRSCLRESGVRRPDEWLDRITSDLPRNADPSIDAYLDVLEQALLDRYLSRHEEAALIDVANSFGLQRDQLAAVHTTYLDSLALAAWADGVVTAAERSELDQVAAMLGLPPRLVQVCLDRAQQLATPTSGAPSPSLRPGDRVAFTGALSLSREQCDELATSAGLVVGTVSKRTALLVAGDPDSLSGKAGKARELGVPIVTEAAFTRLLRPMLDLAPA